MQKTVSINLGGRFFHINEDAFELLEQYLNKLKNHFNKEDGGKEIISDIDIRIAELFKEKVSDSHQVITTDDVAYMQTVLGQPSDFGVEENEEGSEQDMDDFINETYNETSSQEEFFEAKVHNPSEKKFYRDVDEGILGGVCAGLAHYLNWDKNLIRAGFILFTLFGAGFPFPVYIILWFVIPKAVSSSDKMRMKGEPINIENIKKKVQEEIHNVKQSVSDFANDPAKQQRFRKRVKNFEKEVKPHAYKFVQFIKKTLGVWFVLASLFCLMLFLGFFFNIPFIANFISNGTIDWPDSVYQLYLNVQQDDLTYSLAYFGLLGVVAIPLLMIFNGGLKLFLDIKHAVKFVNSFLFVCWIFSILSLLISIALTGKGMVVL